MTRRNSGGFTLVEVIVAIVILTVGVLALLGSSKVSVASLQRATLELRVAGLIEGEVERLRTLPIDSLRDGAATRLAGDVNWLVTDSLSYLRVEVEVVTRPEVGVSLTDTVYVYRPR
jgi:prepilin-type N-terminal cleavage/methylation domain-containing protein